MLTPGQEIPFYEKDPKNPKSHVKGTVKLESVTDGIAKIIENIQIFSEETAGKPMKLNATIPLDTATSKLNRHGRGGHRPPLGRRRGARPRPIHG